MPLTSQDWSSGPEHPVAGQMPLQGAQRQRQKRPEARQPGVGHPLRLVDQLQRRVTCYSRRELKGWDHSCQRNMGNSHHSTSRLSSCRHSSCRHSSCIHSSCRHSSSQVNKRSSPWTCQICLDCPSSRGHWAAENISSSLATLS
jgi:hypothetical protein